MFPFHHTFKLFWSMSYPIQNEPKVTNSIRLLKLKHPVLIFNRGNLSCYIFGLGNSSPFKNNDHFDVISFKVMFNIMLWYLFGVMFFPSAALFLGKANNVQNKVVSSNFRILRDVEGIFFLQIHFNVYLFVIAVFFYLDNFFWFKDCYFSHYALI